MLARMTVENAQPQKAVLVGADSGKEAVLCVPKAAIFPHGRPHGFWTEGIDELLTAIQTQAVFVPRSEAEEDSSFQQIIPYCTVMHSDGTYLMTYRTKQSTESRLHNLYSIGVGGHVNDGGDDAVVSGLTREWQEEVICESPATAKLVGALADNSNEVGNVHLGLSFVVTPKSGHASVREVDKLTGVVATDDDLTSHYQEMETWSQIVLDAMRSGQFLKSGPLEAELPANP
jgi:predicted NUDIX family phosphoesterase